jgi:hypothetical protein
LIGLRQRADWPGPAQVHRQPSGAGRGQQLVELGQAGLRRKSGWFVAEQPEELA